MALSWELAVVGVATTGLLAGGAVAAGALTRPAGALAAVFGSVIVVLGGFSYLALLALFVFASGVATRYAFEEKARRKVQEGRAGERGVSNVLAHIVLPTGLVVAGGAFPSTLPMFPLATLYASAIAFGGADTFASEFGVLTGRARSILTGRLVPAGTNGGVSLLGQLWAFVGAATTAGLGFALFYLAGVVTASQVEFVPLVLAAGFLGCQVDSVLGEVLENRGYLTKGSTNFASMLSAIALAATFLALVGAWR